jgi:hypothetical protein
MIQYKDSGPVAGVDAPGSPDLAAAALHLRILSDTLERLGYPYEAYQVREAAARLLREENEH